MWDGMSGSCRRVNTSHRDLRGQDRDSRLKPDVNPSPVWLRWWLRWIPSSREVRSSGWRIHDRPGELQVAGPSAGGDPTVINIDQNVFPRQRGRRSRQSRWYTAVDQTNTGKPGTGCRPAEAKSQQSRLHCSQPKGEVVVTPKGFRQIPFRVNAKREPVQKGHLPRADPVRLLAGSGSRLCFVSASETSSTFAVRACEAPLRDA